MHDLYGSDHQRFGDYAFGYKHPLFIGVLICWLCFPNLAQSDQAQIYRTFGSGKIQTCKGIFIEACGYEEVSLPALIDQAKSQLHGIWHEKKSDYTMCYMELEGGIWTKKTLMFRCIPVR